MSNADVQIVPSNGAAPAPAPAPAEPDDGRIVLPPTMLARLARMLSASPAVQDLIGAYIEGRGIEGGPYTLIVTGALLAPAPEGRQ